MSYSFPMYACAPGFKNVFNPRQRKLTVYRQCCVENLASKLTSGPANVGLLMDAI